jgi:exodeoxyribonuclease VII small subunit
VILTSGGEAAGEGSTRKRRLGNSAMVPAVNAATEPEPGFDEVLTRLRGIVGRLESGELSLEQALTVYEDGVQLARRGHDLLASAEKRVELLVTVAGKVETVPFPSGGDPTTTKPGP